MTTLYEGAFAKINLTLDVLDKRPDGYHNLKSVMQTISLRDDIEIDVGTGEPWSLLCSVEGIPTDELTLPGRQPSWSSIPSARIPMACRSAF
jgi:4-diphosphocytidyl-2-C-methyl-D-erythritol kinase